LEGLIRFREFKHPERFTLNNRRNFGRDKVLEQTMAMPELKKIAFAFG